MNQQSPSDSSALHPVVGIDLGTTYSAVAAYNHARGETEIIPDPLDSKATTPSVVSFDPIKRAVIVGRSAKRNRPNNPLNTMIEVKRYMGEHFRPEMILQFDPTGEQRFRPRDEQSNFLGDPVRMRFDCGEELESHKWKLPQEISAFTLMKMKDIAESAYGGQKIIDAVITVPAYFTGKQRKATEEAALLAGLYPRQLVPEPTAAAICYGVDQYQDERKVYLVYDLGGGTFDVSIIALDDTNNSVLATSGDPRLGGADFDNAITRWAIGELAQKCGLDISQDLRAKEIVKYHAEQLKIDLSTFTTAQMTLPELNPANPPCLSLERATFNNLISKELDKSLTYVNIAIENAAKEKNIRREEIDAILLVGGSSQIPYVKERLLDYFQKDESFVRDNLDPAAVVARGAAMLAKRYDPTPGPFDPAREIDTSQTAVDEDDVVVHHITEHSLGVGVQDNRVVHIIPRGANIPTEITRGGFTNPDFATQVQAAVYQGEGEYVFDNEEIGTVLIDNIDPQPAQYHQFEVKFSLDQSGLLTAIVHHLNTGQSFVAKFEQPTGVGGKEALKTIRANLLQLYASQGNNGGGIVTPPTINTGGPAAESGMAGAAPPQPGPVGVREGMPTDTVPEPQPSGQYAQPQTYQQPTQQPIPSTQPSQQGTGQPQQTAPPQGVPVSPQSVQPQSVQPQSVQPQSVQPQSVQPQSVQPQAVQPQSVQPQSVQPQSVQPQAVQPQSVQPQSVQPQAAPTGQPVAPPAGSPLVVPQAEVPEDYRRVVRRAEKELRKQVHPELLAAFNAYATALNAGASQEDLEDLGDELEETFFKIKMT